MVQLKPQQQTNLRVAQAFNNLNNSAVASGFDFSGSSNNAMNNNGKKVTVAYDLRDMSSNSKHGQNLDAIFALID